MNDLDVFFHDLPRGEKEIALRLRELVLAAAPDFEEKFSYGVPYYFRHSRITCIWPASAPGGPKRGVFISICRGHLMSNTQGLIEMGNRMQFGLIRYYDVKEIKAEPLMEILQEAIMVDDEIFRAKKIRNRSAGKRR